jgi:hypothetical protein
MKSSDRVSAQDVCGLVGGAVVYNQDLVSLGRIIHTVQRVQAGA